MIRRRRFPRLAFWALAAALLLKAAVPLLAVGAAQAQGRALVEICTVYGLQTVALDEMLPTAAETTDAGRDDSAALPGGDPCVLTAALSLATPAPSAVDPLAVAAARAPHPPARALPAPARDRTFDWAARRKHGPPVLA